MKKILHIAASPRQSASRTLQLAEAFLEAFLDSHQGWIVDELNLWEEVLPSLTLECVDGKYLLSGGKDLTEELKEAWEGIVVHIDRFRTADMYLLSTPMWNFSIPYALKQYIDVIVQPKYLFRYTSHGPEGLITGKKMIVCTSRGGDYSSPETRNFDLQEPYIRTIFGFVGIRDVTFINAQPMDLDRELAHRRLEEAMILAREVARRG